MAMTGSLFIMRISKILIIMHNANTSLDHIPIFQKPSILQFDADVYITEKSSNCPYYNYFTKTKDRLSLFTLKSGLLIQLMGDNI
jgi:hypothetical protein